MQDMGSIIRDHSGYGLHGTWVGGNGPGSGPQAGLNGIVRAFDGSDDVVKAPAVYNLAGRAVSIEMAVKLDALAIKRLFSVRITPGSGMETFYFYHYSNGGLIFARAGGEDNLGVSTTNSLSVNTWYLLHLIHDGTFTDATKVHIYINGIEASYAVQQNGVGNEIGSAGLWCVGGREQAGTFFFDGQMGIVRIYNRVIPAVEVLSLYRENAWRYGLKG